MVKGILVNRKSDEIFKSSFKDHADLVSEMQSVENLPTHERLQLARMRRAQQLKNARQKEKEWMKSQRSKGNGSVSSTNSISNLNVNNGTATMTNATQNSHNNHRHRQHISFENSVVLLEAASRNDIQEVANLLQHGITPDASNEDGLTALHQCCIDNNIEMLKLLLDYGANVDAQDSDKWTPLHAAATCGHLNLVKILINCGANLLAVNTDGNMPYDLCDDENTLDYIEAEMSKRGVTQELIDETRSSTERQMLHDLIEVANCGGDLEEPDYQGATPLHIASANGYTRVVEFLLEQHVNVDALDKDLWSPVHAAACWGHLEVLEMLAQSGADLNAKNKDGETPSDICEDPEIRERIEQLKSEQENKRLAEAQRRRVRRSQSNNTRAQSVRRTSLRDKTLTTKKDAVEEARLRLQAQEVFTAPDGSIDMKPTHDSTLATMNGGSSVSMLDDHFENSLSFVQQQQQQQQNLKFNSNANCIQNWMNGSHPLSKSNHLNSNDNKSSSSSPNAASRINSNGSIFSHSHSFDAIDATTKTTATTTTNHQHTSSIHNSRRPPDGKEKDDNDSDNEGDGSGKNGNNFLTMTKIMQPSVGATPSLIVNNHSEKFIADRSSSITPDLKFQPNKEPNGKINVQVTVLVDTTTTNNNNINNNTLSNLKKQRSQSRSNALNENGSIIGGGGTSLANSIDAASVNSRTAIATNQPMSSMINPTLLELSPLSSMSNVSELSATTHPQVTKFSGITGDVVSDSTSSKKCCLLM